SAAASYRAFPQTLTTYLVLNARSGPLSDVAIRRAIAMALDRAELATASNQTPTFRLLPPGVRGGQTPRLGEADLERARRLRGARHLMVRMAVQAGDEQGGRLADLVRAELAPLGIDVRP